jgi:uncharacterized membrane protein
MSKAEEEIKPGSSMGFTVERLNAFSDGVFAVAITLLVVSIALPTIHGNVTEAKMAHGLAAVWPHFFAYGLSFVIIGMFWVSHHALFSAITKVNRVLIWMNLFYLLLIVFMPYPTNVLALFGQTTVATILYASVLALAGFMQALMGWYAVRDHRLVDDAFDLKEASDYIRGALIMTAVFLISIVIAIFNPSAAQYFWAVLFITPMVEHLLKRKKEPKATELEVEEV